MTSEVVLLNRSCIALAADSAATVSYWEDGERKTRYFKGANKIFNLSVAHPVGLLTYGSASLQGVPWEVIVKAYRRHLESRSHDELPGYAQDFFDFVESNAQIFSVPIQDKQFKTQVDRAAANIVLPILHDQRFGSASDEAARKAAFATLFAQRIAVLESSTFLPRATQADVDSAISRFGGRIQAMLEEDLRYEKVPRNALPTLSRSAILGVFKEDFGGIHNTGLAFVGYGDKEHFPHMTLYRCRGMVLGKLLSVEESEVLISEENAADVVPLAMSAMIETFIWGIGTGEMEEIASSFKTQAAEIFDAVRQAGHLPASVDVRPFITSAEEKYFEELIGKLHAWHRAPLRRVIGILPFREMAELAEALVFMESLKQRVTSPKESVSGPIDVALISKGDGFVWIKRKHYFDPKLNPRFFNRHSLAS